MKQNKLQKNYRNERTNLLASNKIGYSIDEQNSMMWDYL